MTDRTGRLATVSARAIGDRHPLIVARCQLARPTSSPSIIR